VIPFIDIHSHNGGSKPAETLTIVNLIAGNEDAGAHDGFCSVGLHPWHLDHAATRLAGLQAVIGLPNVLAVGECGLDRVCKSDWSIQNEAFKAQILMARTAGKPLIIHCVRAYAEVLALLTSGGVPFVFHGFNRNAAIARQVLDAGGWLSFGPALLQHPQHLVEVLQMVPPERLFLETDDTPVGIERVYEAAAAIRKTPMDALILQLDTNFNSFFHGI
jgi:TatD DNase family protein